jgi:hypothetical protein
MKLHNQTASLRIAWFLPHQTEEEDEAKDHLAHSSKLTGYQKPEIRQQCTKAPYKASNSFRCMRWSQSDARITPKTHDDEENKKNHCTSPTIENYMLEQNVEKKTWGPKEQAKD